MVVWKGDKAIRSLAISQHPSTWTDELIYEIPKDDWVQNIFFKQQTIRRLELIKEHYEFSPDDVPYTDSEINRVLAENDAEIQWQEKVFANAYSRRMVIGYSFLFLLLLFNPFG